MGAVGLLAASEIRRRWRSTLAIALLVGIVGAIVFATAAGARRSATALERFNTESRTANIEVSIGVGSEEKVAKFAKTPGIEAITHLRAYAFDLSHMKKLAQSEALAIAAPLDHAMGDTVDRSRIVAGRRANPLATNEITIGESLPALTGLHVGSELDLPTYTADQMRIVYSGGQPGAAAGPHVRFDVVGIDRRPLDLGVRSTVGGVIILSPNFSAKWNDRIGTFTDVLRVKTTGDATDTIRISTAARRAFGQDVTFSFENLSIETEGARNAIDVLTTGLWIVTAVTALAGLVAIGIVLTRDFGHTDLDQATLRGLGLTRRQRVTVALPRTILVAALSGALGILGAIALSPLFPIGVARRADPDPGLHVDWVVIGIAAAVVAAVVFGFSLSAALRSSRASRSRQGSLRTSTIVERAASTGLRPSATNGLRMAIQAGNGDQRIPVRSAFTGAVFGVAGVTAALVFAASLGHLVDTPRLFGWTWDAKAEVDAGKGPCQDRLGAGLAKQAAVAAVAHVCTTDVEIDGHPITAWGFQQLHGTIDPEVVAGRAPRGPHEVALGAKTLSTLHKGIGDTVHVRGYQPPREYVVVGRIVLPTIGDSQPLADGAVFTDAGWLPLYDNTGNESHFLVVKARPGRVTESVSAIKEFPQPPPFPRNVGTATLPVEITRLQQVDQIPLAIAALLGVLALLAVGYALVTAVRRRRHELAVLKILGFGRGQVRATIAWQATILGTVGLVLGIPAGFVVGRLAWQLVADGLGVSTDVTTPVLGMILFVPVALVFVNLIAYFPGRSAANTRPAVALREE